MTHDHEDIDIEFPQAPPDRLYAHNRRQLSAMLDGELSPDQARFMLRRLQHDTELAACWERWQVCGDVLRGGGHSLLPADFSRRVMAAVTVPAGSGATAPGRATDSARPQQRLLRWGGGALAASVALVALFMARQLPDPQAQGQLEAATAMRTTPVLVEGAAADGLAVAGEAAAQAAETTQPPAQAADPVLPALLAAAAPAVVATAELPRRTASGERSSRGQVQRAALRRSQAAVEPPAQIALAPQAGLPVLTGGAADSTSDSLFGALPAASTRPWPRAVLPGIARPQPFAAGYGLPTAEAFAPFQPRLEQGMALPEPRAWDAAAPEPGAGTAGSEPDGVH